MILSEKFSDHLGINNPTFRKVNFHAAIIQKLKKKKKFQCDINLVLQEEKNMNTSI